MIILATVGWPGWQFAQSRSAPDVELVDTVGALVINHGGHVVYRDEYPTAYATLKGTPDGLNP